ncbi:MAG: MBL fold metallo-hydrolase, partial [Stellaceae bacterium]
MRFGFETIGNATLVFHENDRPVLATDPWIVGTCYFGSWGLDRPLDERELATVLSAEYIWISHGHPDHLHFESLQLLSKDKKILIPDHYHSEIYDSLRCQGFTVKILQYRQWQQLSPGIRCLCLDNENQDGILIVEVGDSLVVNL